MGHFLVILIALTVFAVVTSLLLGLVTMMRGGELAEKYGNKLMVARIAFQGLALALLGVLWAVSK